MCPSSKLFEKDFFKSLVELSHAQAKPIPIAIAITNAWVLRHQEEFTWLRNQRELEITWVSHSAYHAYYPDLGFKDNFMNFPRTNVMQEILGPEKMLISYGLTPSVFFRFPGLVASDKLLKTLNGLGLIPVSADAWLAKGEKPDAGSIILVHGNSNEHIGIERFMRWNQNNKLPFLPLRYAIVPASTPP